MEEDLKARARELREFQLQISSCLVMFFDKKEYRKTIHLHGMVLKVIVSAEPWEIIILPLDASKLATKHHAPKEAT